MVNTEFEDMVHYRFRPRAVGGEMVLSLTDDALEVRGGSKIIRIAYNEITHIQILFRPTSFLTKQFKVLVRDKRGARLKISNVTYRGFGEVIEQNESFMALIQGLHEKLKPFAKSISFTKGEPLWRYYGVALASIALLAMGLFVILETLRQGKLLALIITTILVYMCVMIWQWLSNSRPESYNGVLTKELLPL